MEPLTVENLINKLFLFDQRNKTSVYICINGVPYVPVTDCIKEGKRVALLLTPDDHEVNRMA